MRGCRFLGRRNGIRRYIIIVTILVVMVIGGIKISSRDNDFRLVHENNQNYKVDVFTQDQRKSEHHNGDRTADVGLEDKVDLGKGSPTYGSEEDEYYVDSKEYPTYPVYPSERDDSLKPQQQDNEIMSTPQQLQQTPKNEFAVHTFDTFDNNKDTQNPEQFDQKIGSENQVVHNLQENDHSLKEQTDKTKTVFRFHPESYYDSEEDTVNDNQKTNDNEKPPIPAITKVMTFSQYDDEGDTDGVQPNSPSNVDRIDENNLSPEIGANEEISNANLPLIVPNVVHFVWFGNSTMKFHQMLSILSVHHFVKPEYIYYHCDSHPTGEWWQRVTSIVSNVKVDIMSPPNEIFGFQIFTAKQQADVAKLQTLMTHGGIYLDTDVIVTKSLQPLRSYEFSIGYSQPGRFNSDIVISTHTSKFLQKWLVAYTQYSGAGSDDFFSCVAPYKIYRQNPDQVHVVKRMSTPTAKNVDSLYNGDLDWTNYYAVHLWRRLHDQVDNLDTVKDLDTPYGKLIRLIYNKV